jgi:hypothetical protein
MRVCVSVYTHTHTQTSKEERHVARIGDKIPQRI